MFNLIVNICLYCYLYTGSRITRLFSTQRIKSSYPGNRVMWDSSYFLRKSSYYVWSSYVGWKSSYLSLSTWQSYFHHTPFFYVFYFFYSFNPVWPGSARAGFIQFGSMADFMLNVLRRILEVNQLIIQFSHQRDNTPAIFDLLWFDADLTVQLLSVQREYLYQIFGMQVLLAFLWILFFE